MPAGAARGGETGDASGPVVRILFGGDTMLGRLVARSIELYGHMYPLGALHPYTRAADTLVLNLECAITRRKELFRGQPKAFYFGAPPQAASCLREMNVGMVSLANNHVLDFDREGLAETLALLDAHGIRHCGAGPTLAAASAPAQLELRGLRLGMAAFCDHQADFAAGPSRPGMAYLDLGDESRALRAFDAALAQLGGVDWPILSLHWGSNWATRPSRHFQRLASASVDMGWKILFGHSPHVFQGIAVDRGCPLMYGVGDLVDDYAVDPVQRNDHQLLIALDLQGDKLLAISALPLFIDDCRVQPAAGRQAAWIRQRLAAACGEFGLTLRVDERDPAWLRVL